MNGVSLKQILAVNVSSAGPGAAGRRRLLRERGRTRRAPFFHAPRPQAIR